MSEAADPGHDAREVRRDVTEEQLPQEPCVVPAADGAPDHEAHLEAAAILVRSHIARDLSRLWLRIVGDHHAQRRRTCRLQQLKGRLPRDRPSPPRIRYSDLGPSR